MLACKRYSQDYEQKATQNISFEHLSYDIWRGVTIHVWRCVIMNCIVVSYRYFPALYIVCVYVFSDSQVVYLYVKSSKLNHCRLSDQSSIMNVRIPPVSVRPVLSYRRDILLYYDTFALIYNLYQIRVFFVNFQISVLFVHEWSTCNWY